MWLVGATAKGRTDTGAHLPAYRSAKEPHYSRPRLVLCPLPPTLPHRCLIPDWLVLTLEGLMSPPPGSLAGVSPVFTTPGETSVIRLIHTVIFIFVCRPPSLAS